MIYRPAFPSDYDEIVALHRGGDGLKEALHAKQVFVACRNDRIVGVVRAVPQDAVSYIASLFVAREHRRTGIGRSLIDYTLEAIGLPAIAVAYQGNDNFWASCGFYSTTRLWEKRTDV